MAVERFGLHPARASGFNADAAGDRLHQHTRPGRVGAGEPGLDGRLLRAETAAISAVAAVLALVAAADVARHRVDVPAEIGEAALQDLLAMRRRVVLLVHAEPLADSVERV